MWNSPRTLNTLAAMLFAIALVVICGEVLFWMAQRPMFALRSIRVEGQNGIALRHVNAASVRAAALAQVQGNFFTVSLEGVRQAFEGVPWVSHARVRREWPNRLVVKVEEHHVLGTWEDGRLVDTNGELFTANLAEAQDDKDDLPELSGPSGSEKDVTQRLHDFTTWFARLNLTPDQVTLSPRYAWTVRLENGTDEGLTVELGREQNSTTLSERVNRMIVAYPAVTSKWPKLTLVDLRYPNGFALRAENLHVANENVTKPAANAAEHKPQPARKRT